MIPPALRAAIWRTFGNDGSVDTFLLPAAFSELTLSLDAWQEQFE
jgi:hypothetical protein